MSYNNQIMKNIILIFIGIGLITFYGCSNKREKSGFNDFQMVAIKKLNGEKWTIPLIQVMTIDSCEYIVWGGSHSEIGFAHKGNCKWCHIRQTSKIN